MDRFYIWNYDNFSHAFAVSQIKWTGRRYHKVMLGKEIETRSKY